MKLIEIIESRIDKDGSLRKWGKFLCLFCNKQKELPLRDGKRNKSCGCQKDKLIGIANKGKKRTDLQNKLNSERKKKYWDSLSEEGRKLTEEHKNKIGEGNKGHFHTEETKSKIKEARKNQIIGCGALAPNWNNGSSFEPYSPEFNKEKKQQVLERDNYTCQNPNCDGNHKKLHIHHIDYDKKNNNSENLITLCHSCHTKTNGKKSRNYWTKFYQGVLKEIYGL